MPLANHLQRDTPAASVSGPVEQVIEGSRSDRWWRLMFPFKEILVTSHDPVDAMLTGEGHQVVIVSVTSCGFDRRRISNHFSDATNRAHVQLSQPGFHAFAKPWPVEDIFHLGEKSRTDHDLKVTVARPPGDQSVRRPRLNGSRDQNIRVENNLHGWPQRVRRLRRTVRTSSTARSMASSSESSDFSTFAASSVLTRRVKYSQAD